MSGIEPIAAPMNAHAHDQRQQHRSGAHFGRVLARRETVQSKLRVDPGAATARLQAPQPKRRGDSGVDIEV